MLERVRFFMVAESALTTENIIWKTTGDCALFILFQSYIFSSSISTTEWSVTRRVVFVLIATCTLCDIGLSPVL